MGANIRELPDGLDHRGRADQGRARQRPRRPPGGDGARRGRDFCRGRDRDRRRRIGFHHLPDLLRSRREPEKRLTASACLQEDTKNTKGEKKEGHGGEGEHGGGREEGDFSGSQEFRSAASSEDRKPGKEGGKSDSENDYQVENRRRPTLGAFRIDRTLDALLSEAWFHDGGPPPRRDRRSEKGEAVHPGNRP